MNKLSTWKVGSIIFVLRDKSLKAPVAAKGEILCYLLLGFHGFPGKYLEAEKSLAWFKGSRCWASFVTVGTTMRG